MSIRTFNCFWSKKYYSFRLLERIKKSHWTWSTNHIGWGNKVSIRHENKTSLPLLLFCCVKKKLFISFNLPLKKMMLWKKSFINNTHERIKITRLDRRLFIRIFKLSYSNSYFFLCTNKIILIRFSNEGIFLHYLSSEI